MHVSPRAKALHARYLHRVGESRRGRVRASRRLRHPAQEQPPPGVRFGPHYCLGASLASLEAQVAVGTLLERTRTVRRIDDAPLPLHPSIVFRGVRSLPVQVDPA
jgi:cytochrome P450